MKKITIAISTINNALEKELLIKLAEYDRALNGKVFFLVISQGAGFEEEYTINENIKLIRSNTIGLSKSRNIAIKNCKTNWIWFQDDDIELNVNNTLALIQKLNLELDFYFIKVGSLEEKNKFFKRYNFHGFKSNFLAFKISSIEIIANVNFLKSENISFFEGLGLGTMYPCCEENLFLFESFLKTKSYEFIDLICCYHTTIAEVRNIDYVARYRARRVLLSKIPFMYSFILSLRWLFRFDDKVNFKTRFLILFKNR